MTFNEAGLDLLKEFEGCRLEAYRDLNGLWTVAWGHRCEGPQTIPQEEADALLLADANQTAKTVQHLLTRELDEYEFSALVCLAYNIGTGNLARSQVLGKVNADENPSKEWLAWDHVGGVEVPGLMRRRLAELALYFTV